MNLPSTSSIPALPSLPLLRAFHSVASHQSLTRAASALRRSQPALTISIAKLERQLDVSLLDRGRSGAHVTQAGAILLRRTQRMLDRLEAAFAHLDSTAGAARWQDRISDAQARCVASLADHHTIERSAEALGITAASLRRTAQSLEQLVGRTLLQPIAHGLGTSRLGSEVARRTKLALGEIAAGIDEIEIARGRFRSRIAIGVVPLSATRLVAMAINDLLQEFPAASVSIAHGPYEPLLDDLLSARIDLLYGVLRLPAGHSEVKQEPLFFDPYVIAVRRGHPLTKCRQLLLDDLARYDWIAPRIGTPRRQNLQLMFEACSRSPKVAIETSSLNVQRALLISSDRVMLLTRHEMDQEAAIGDLVSLSFVPPVVRGHDGIATRIDWHPTPVQARFLEFLRTRCRQPSSSTTIEDFDLLPPNGGGEAPRGKAPTLRKRR